MPVRLELNNREVVLRIRPDYLALVVASVRKRNIELFRSLYYMVVGKDVAFLVYYGAADTAIGVAMGKLRDLIPSLDDQ